MKTQDAETAEGKTVSPSQLSTNSMEVEYLDHHRNVGQLNNWSSISRTQKPLPIFKMENSITFILGILIFLFFKHCRIYLLNFLKK